VIDMELDIGSPRLACIFCVVSSSFSMASITIAAVLAPLPKRPAAARCGISCRSCSLPALSDFLLRLSCTYDLQTPRAGAPVVGSSAARSLGALGLYSVWPWLPLPRREARPRTIAFYGFSILGEVMNMRVFPAFEADWQARTGERVQFVSAFAGSGTVANQVIMGVPAEFALLSLELDAQKIAKAGVVPDGSWRKLPHEGVVNRTPFVTDENDSDETDETVRYSDTDKPKGSETVTAEPNSSAPDLDSTHCPCRGRRCLITSSIS
jgi:hypothetical protein